MIRIAIIDDEEEMLAIIHNHVQKAVDFKQEIDIFTYSDPAEFLEEIAKGMVYDILFLDIQLNGMDGLELGKRVLEKQPDIFLIFVTSYPEFAVESYVLDAYQYILKSDMEWRIPEIVGRLVRKISEQAKPYLFVGGTSKQRICRDEIIYVYKSKSEKYVQYITVNGEYRERITLSQVMEKLQSNEFILVARGYIVNIKYIVKMDGNTIYLENGAKVIISRARFSKVKEKINYYWGNEIW